MWQDVTQAASSKFRSPVWKLHSSLTSKWVLQLLRLKQTSSVQKNSENCTDKHEVLQADKLKMGLIHNYYYYHHHHHHH
jgi:hypothetical protein